MDAISIKNLCFSYATGPVVLDIEQMRVGLGEKVFLYGPSGCGKTTLLGLIAGVLAPSQKRGHLNVLGQEMTELSSRQRDRLRGEKIGYIFQSFNLIPYLSVLENIVLPTRICSARLKGDPTLRASELAEHLGLKGLLHKKVTELSIGQQQRVAGARAFMGDPQLIVADEPTSSLDEENTGEFLELLLREANENKTSVLFVSHDPRLARYFDRELSLPKINRALHHEEVNA